MKRKGIMLLACLSLVSASLGIAACDDHTHTYDTATWKSNATAHWHAATCAHTDEKSDVDGHADANRDGVCDVCGYDGAHAHTYDTEAWLSDETGHWNGATCFHDVKGNFAEHTANDIGDCTVCGYHVSDPDVSTVAKAVTLSTAQKAKVENGVVTTGGDNPSTAKYLYGNGYFYVSESNVEAWFAKDVNDEVYGVARNNEDGSVRRLTAFADTISEENLQGYEFAGIVPSNILGNFYGVEGLVKGLYEIGAENLNKDFAEKVEEGVYSFSFGYYEDHELYMVEVSFTLDSQYRIDTMSAKSTRYYHYTDIYMAPYSQVEVLGEGDEVTYAPKAEAEGSLSAEYTVKQNVEMSVNEYPAEEVLVSEFKLVDANDQEVTETINLYTKQAASFYLANTAPDTAILALTDVSCTGAPIDNWQVLYKWNEEDSLALVLTAYAAGDYDITITINGVAKNVTLHVVDELPTQINVNSYVVGGEYWDDPYYVNKGAASETITVYTDMSVVLDAAVDKGTNTDYTVTVEGKEATLSEVMIRGAWNPDWQEYDMEWKDMLVVDTSVAGTYEIVFTSEAVATVTKTITVVVEARPDMKEVLNGTHLLAHENGYNTVEVEFAPMEDPDDPDFIGGYMYVYYRTMVWDEETEQDVLTVYGTVYMYGWALDEEDNEIFATIYVNGYEGNLVTVGEDTDYKIQVNGITLKKATQADLLAGAWKDWNANTITLSADGTGAFKTADAATEVYFKYSVAADTGVITFVQDTDKTNVGTTDVFTYDMEGTVNEYGSLVVGEGYYAKQDDAVLGHELGVELDPEYGMTTIYASDYEDLESAKELFIMAVPGTYTISVHEYWGDVITTTDQYYFLVNGVKVVGALTFEVSEEVEFERISVDFVFVNKEADFDIYVSYVEPPKAEEAGDTITVSNYDGQVVVTDNLNAKNGGTFEYLVTATGVEFYKDGVKDETIYINKVSEGVYKFKSASIGDKMGPQLMEAQDGQTDISGRYSVYCMMPDAVVLEFTKYNKPTGKVEITLPAMMGGATEYNYLVKDDNSVAFYDANGALIPTMSIVHDGTSYVFTNTEIMLENAAMVAGAGQVDISGTYTITMPGASITFVFTAGEFVMADGGDQGSGGANVVENGVPMNITIPANNFASPLSISMEGLAAGTYTVSLDMSSYGVGAGNISVYVTYGGNEYDLNVTNDFTATITVEADATLGFASFNEVTAPLTVTLAE